MTNIRNKSYSELITLKTFEERVLYLKTFSNIGSETFGSARRLNQVLYNSPRWKHCRRRVILRDKGLDLGLEDRLIYGTIVVHHIQAITLEDILEESPMVYSFENLITCSSDTHNIIHFSKDIPEQNIIERKENDTSPWKIK